MIIAGAGGHALEVLALVKERISLSELALFDENPKLAPINDQVLVLTSEEQVKSRIQINPDYCLGIGNPSLREKFDRYFTGFGGCLQPIISSNSVQQSESNYADIMSFGFIGPKVNLGRGVLVNTRASIHHECSVGDYSEIGPGAILLGNVKIGKKCRIGAGAIILPGITLGNEVVVGAGAVVTKSITSNFTVVGVPAKPV